MRRRLGWSWNQIARVDAARGALALVLLVLSQRASAQGSSGVELSVERCAGAPFDIEAYAQALEVELRVLNAASLVPGTAPEGARGPQLIVMVPGCADELQVTLRMRDREADEALRASDFTGVGQPRALALATIEVLRVLSLRLQAGAGEPVGDDTAGEGPDAGASEPAPGEPAEGEPAEEKPAEDEPTEPKPAAVEAASAPPQASDPERAAGPIKPSGPPPWLALHVRGGAGAVGAPDGHVHAGAALALQPSVWVKAELGYGYALDRTSLGALTAHQATLGALLELRVRPFGPFELWVASGLRAALAVVSLDSELPLAPGQSTRDVLALLLLAPLELGAAIDVGDGFIAGLLVEPGLWLAGARFDGPGAADLGMPERGGSPPRLELHTFSLQAGLMLGYRF
jgi:hypothetical protein